LSAGVKSGRAALVTTRAELDHALESARGAGAIGLDTEFMRERTYRARLCLVQIATFDHAFLIDPLEGADLGGVADLIADESVEVIVHAGKQDLELFHEDYGVIPKRVFDVQLAAGFAGHGASLPYGRLVEGVLGVSLDKGESYTDWCRRPLTEAQLRYAGDDVRYLLGIAQRLKERLRELGRLGWVEQEMQSLEDPGGYGIDPSDVWRKVAGRGTLSGRQTAVLKEVARWREETAARRNLPRGWIIKDPTLVEIARRSPSSIGQLQAIRGMNVKEAERSGNQILAAVELGRRGPAIESPKPAGRAVQVRARMMAGLADAVVRARCEEAGIATELVSTRSELEAVLIEIFLGLRNGSDHRLLNGWRRDLAGRAIVDLARGRIAVKGVERPPYVEEVALHQSGEDRG
jgi:ribonuclease D